MHPYMRPEGFMMASFPLDCGHGKGRMQKICYVRFNKEELHDSTICALFIRTLQEGKGKAEKLVVELPKSEPDASDIGKAFQTAGKLEIRLYD